MSALKDFNTYFQNELVALKRLSRNYADRHEQAARRLKIQGGSIADPHVNRLIDGFALLAARIQKRLDDDFPEITDALLGIAYPHLIRPVPSISIAHFQLDMQEAQLTSIHTLPRGLEIVSYPLENGIQCRFRTSAAVDIVPISVVEAKLTPVERAPFKVMDPRTYATLLLRLEVQGPESISALKIPRLRFFVDSDGSEGYALYELLLNSVIQLRLSDENGNNVHLPTTALRGAGFDPDESLFDYDGRSHAACRLLHEYFVFPEKFLFVDLEGMTLPTRNFGRRLDIMIEFNRFSRRERLPRLSQVVGPDTLKLGCVPVVNLFKMDAMPLQMKHRLPEYLVRPDRVRRDAIEVYSIDMVERLVEDDVGVHSIEVPQFFDLQHGARERSDGNQFWHATRRQSQDVPGSDDVFLSVVDRAMSPASRTDDTLAVQATWTNRDLPHKLMKFGGSGRGDKNSVASAQETRSSRGDLYIDGPSIVRRIKLLRRPTLAHRPILKNSARWRLISHLALNSISLCQQGRETLLELLSLYNVTESESMDVQIRSIAGLSSLPGIARVIVGDRPAFVRGLDLTVELDEDLVANDGAYLFGSILERFFGLYVSINSYTRLVARSQSRDGGDLAKWPPRAGMMQLV